MSEWRSELFLGEVRESLSHKTVLIAGCGADGSHAAEALGSVMIHSDKSKIILADPDIFEQGNMGIQIVDSSYIGVNKALATKTILNKKFTNIEVEAYSDGITLKNVGELVSFSDYVIDATDIAVTGIASALHKSANENDIPVIVPWSLGFGGAIMSFNKQGGFDEWGEKANGIAINTNHEQIKEIARWLVDLPDGLTKEHLLQILSGQSPTPTTYFGASTGGQLAVRWICAHSLDEESVPYFPHVLINSAQLLTSVTTHKNYQDAIRDTLLRLV